MADAGPGPGSKRDGPDYLEIMSAVVLSVAALVSSWASYQSGLWDGEQAARYSRANAQRILATREALEGQAKVAIEVQGVEAWLEAKARGDTKLAGFYETRLSPDLKPAFNAWLKEKPLTNRLAPASPFSMPGYRRPGVEATAKLDAQADDTFAKGQYANAVSDAFEQGATALALSLFFGGIGQVFRGKGTRVALITIATVALTIGVLRIFALPIQVLGFGPPGAG